jgi:uridine kinase
VAIDGRGGSGKTRLVRQLVALDPSLKRLPLDHFPCRADEHPFHPSGVQTRISCARVLETLRSLTQNMAAVYERTFWWHTDRDSATLQIEPGGTVLVEGSYALLKDLRPLLDFAIWIECPPALALARALAREAVDAASYSAWMNGHLPTQERYIETQRPSEFADLVLIAEADGSLRHRGT